MTNELSPIQYATHYNVQLQHCGRYTTIATCFTKDDAQAIIDAPSNKRDWAHRAPRITANNKVAKFAVTTNGNQAVRSTYSTLLTAKRNASRLNRRLPEPQYYVAQYQNNAWVRVA